MGHSHGIKWTKEMVEEEIFKVVNALNLDRMPTKNEIESITHNTSLTNKISKSGGFKHWASELSLNVKSSETSIGLEYEYKLNDFMLKLGYRSVVTSIKHPYDVLVESGTKIDVKVSKGYITNKNLYFSFNLEKKIPRCDIYVFYCDNEKCKKTLIIPANKLIGMKQLCIGIKSKYDCYEDQYCLIEDHVKFIESFGEMLI